MCGFEVDEEFRNDADDGAAFGQRRVRGHSHEADMAAAVNESNAALGQQRAETGGALFEDGPASLGGTAIEAQRTDRRLKAMESLSFG